MDAISTDSEIRKQCAENVLDILRLITDEEAESFSRGYEKSHSYIIDLLEPFDELGEDFLVSHKTLEFQELEGNYDEVFIYQILSFFSISERNSSKPTETDYFTDDFLAIKQQLDSEVIHAEEAPDKAEDENKIPCYKKYFTTPKEKFFTPEFLKFMDEVHESCDLENLLEELHQRDVCESEGMR